MIVFLNYMKLRIIIYELVIRDNLAVSYYANNLGEL